MEIHDLELIAGHGYDLRRVQEQLGDVQFKKLQDFLKDKSLFVCGHDKDDQGFEVPCVYRADLEAFLKGQS